MMKYLLLLIFLSIVFAFSNAKNGEFSRQDAEIFVELLDEEGAQKMEEIMEKGEIEQNSRKFGTEFKMILAKLEERIGKAEAQKISQAGEMRELDKEEKKKLGEAYWYLFGSNLLGQLLEYSFLNERVFEENHSLFGPKSIGERREEMGKMWGKFYGKVREILDENRKLALDEKFVRDLAAKGEYSVPLRQGKLGRHFLEENAEMRAKRGMEEAGMDAEQARREFPFAKSRRLLDRFCWIINEVNSRGNGKMREEMERWVRRRMGTFKCPGDSEEVVELLRKAIFALGRGERGKVLEFLTSELFRKQLVELGSGEMRTLVREGRWHVVLFWGMEWIVGQEIFRFLMANLFIPMFKLLSKFGDQWFLERNLFVHFLLELGIEMAKREGDKGEIHFQGGLSEKTADFLEAPPKELAKIVKGLKEYSVDLVGGMPKKLADSMEGVFNSAGVEIGKMEFELRRFVEKERRKLESRKIGREG